MIDIHCHLLPGIDDGSPSLETSIDMAKIAVADGIADVVCTPHIYPGLYNNAGPDIQRRVSDLQSALEVAGIPLRLHYGADTHLVPGLLAQIQSKTVPTIDGSRYLLLEPSHHVRPPQFKESVFELIAHGIVPILTHPERLTWAAQHYDDFTDLAKSGAWLQITGGALLGSFGNRAQELAERFVGDGWAAVLASDAHSATRRPPQLAAAKHRIEQLVGGDEAMKMVMGRPAAVLANQAIPLEGICIAAASGVAKPQRSWVDRLFRR